MNLSNQATAYFDNAATTFPKPEAVYSFMDCFYRNYGVNIGRGQYELAEHGSNLVSETRRLMLDLLHCSSKEVIFTPSATEALNVILQGISWQDNMNVYISPFEHNAVSRPLHLMASHYRINVITLDVDRASLSFDLEKIKYQFQENKPHLLVVSHASNVCGAVAPILELCNMAKKYCAITVVDMSQTAGLIDTNLTDVQADFAVFAGHKTLYGPFGIAGFVGNHIADIAPLIYGGTGVDSSNPSLPDVLPERFEAGSPNIAAIAGLNAALKWNKEIGIETIAKREHCNTLRLQKLLQQYSNIKVFQTDSAQIGVVSCIFNGYASDSIGRILGEHNIAVRTGLHCAPAAHRFLGTFPAGTVRFSVGFFNSEQDFDMLKSALDYIAENG